MAWSLLRSWLKGHGGQQRGRVRRPARWRARPGVEALEDRCVPAIYEVTSAADLGAGSLRAAVEKANANPAPDNSIIFDNAKLTGLTIHLHSQIAITGDLTIQGLGADKLTISGGDRTRIFAVNDHHSDKLISVQINNITLSHGLGDAGGAEGGAVDSAEKLTLRNCTLSHNKAELRGGAIMNQGGQVILENTTFSHNGVTATLAGHGGAVYSAAGGVVTITGGAFTHNQSSDSGGAIHNKGTLTVTGTQFTSNTAVFAGGAIMNDSTATLTGTGFTSNKTTRTDVSYGGAVRNGGTMVVNSSTFTDNSTTTAQPTVGGAFYNGGTLTLNDTTLSRNRAGTNGGGIDNTGTLTLQRSYLLRNTSNRDGGGISNGGSGEVKIYQSTLRGNTSHHDGGGVANGHGTVVIVESTVAENTAKRNGGGAYNAPGDRLEIFQSTVYENKANFGGGVFNARERGAEPATVVLSNSIVGSSQDGGDFAGDKAEVTLEGVNWVSDGTFGNDGRTIFSGDAKLGPLDNNGGPTPTYVPRPDSPVINKGSNLDIPTDPKTGQPYTEDQRGAKFPRIVNGRVDIGAVEFQGP
jgi:predicted outer membrane repeat protein